MRTLIVLLVFALPATAATEGYPTTEIVKFVVGCMADNGGQTEENLYMCTCRFDSISSKFSFEDYDNALMFERYRDMPGKRGGIVRDNEEGRVLTNKMRQAREEAAAQCPRVVRIEREPPADRK
jgi:hypothetical protein